MLPLQVFEGSVFFHESPDIVSATGVKMTSKLQSIFQYDHVALGELFQFFNFVAFVYLLDNFPVAF